MGEKLIIDTDPGYDDAAMLCMMLSSERHEILAVTTVFGNNRLEVTTRNACRVLEYLGYNDIPVYKGTYSALQASEPFFYDLVHIHGEDGINNPPTIPITSSKQPHPNCFAPLEIIKLVKKFPGEVTLIATGPLTNIAIALKICPELPKLVKKFFMMGGSTYEGNITEWCEYNVFCDPHAAHQVLTEFTRHTLVHLIPWETAIGCTIPYDDYLGLFSKAMPLTKAKVLLQETGWPEREDERFENTPDAGYRLADQFVPLALLYPQSVKKVEYWEFLGINLDSEHEQYGLMSVNKMEKSSKGILAYVEYDIKWAVTMFKDAIMKAA